MNKLSIILGIFIIFSINPLKAAQTEEEQIQQAMRLSLETAEQEQKDREERERSRIEAIEKQRRLIEKLSQLKKPQPDIEKSRRLQEEKVIEESRHAAIAKQQKLLDKFRGNKSKLDQLASADKDNKPLQEIAQAFSTLAEDKEAEEARLNYETEQALQQSIALEAAKLEIQMDEAAKKQKGIEIKPKTVGQKKEPISPKPLLNLIITLDNTEKYDKPIITGELAVACCQAQNPIITLGYSLRVLLDWQQNDDDLKNAPLISDEIWNYYKVQNSDFYLLIPKEYSRETYYNFRPLNFKLDHYDLDPYEALIGFKINTESILKKVTADEIKKTVNLDSYNQTIKIEPLFNIFVHGQDDFLRLWNIYLTGHGAAPKKLSDVSDKTYSNFVKEVDIKNARICNLSIEEFRKLISFFNEKIRVNFFYYVSCYAGGYNRILPYITNIINSRGNITSNNKPKFTIATNSTTDAVVPIFFNLSKQCVKKPNQIEKGYFDYLTFFDQLYQLSSGIKSTIFNDEELKKILAPISFMAKSPTDATPLESLPQVMSPETEIFRVVPLENDIEIISNVSLNKNILEKKPINSENKRAILIYPQDVPIEINIKCKTFDNFPIIISMTPGIGLTKFESLNMNTSLTNLIKSLTYGKSVFEKYFYIKKLNIINELRGLSDIGRKINLYNVLFYIKYNKPRVYRREVLPEDISAFVIFVDDNNDMYFFDFKTNRLKKIKQVNKKLEFPNVLVPYFTSKEGPYALVSNQIEDINKAFNFKALIRTLSTKDEFDYIKKLVEYMEGTLES